MSGLSVPIPTLPSPVILTTSDVSRTLDWNMKSFEVPPDINFKSEASPFIKLLRVPSENLITGDADCMCNASSGSLVPIPTLPSFVMRSLSSPSVITLKCPSDPVSITSAEVFPSLILSVITPPRLEAGIQSRAVPVELNIEPAAPT